MFQRALISLTALVAISFFSHRAEAAGFGLRNTFGQSLYIVQPRVNTDTGCKPCYNGDLRKPLDLEIMPYYTFGIISIDLAMMFNLEQRDLLGTGFTFRPGVRVFPFLGLYVRASLPITMAQLGTNSAFVWFNLSVGLGYELSISKWGIMAEVNFNPALQANPVWTTPVEFRVGIRLQE